MLVPGGAHVTADPFDASIGLDGGDEGAPVRLRRGRAPRKPQRAVLSPCRQPHRAQHVTARVALRGARGAVRDGHEIAPRVDGGLRVHAREREVQNVGHRPVEVAVDHRVERRQTREERLAERAAPRITRLRFGHGQFGRQAQAGDERHRQRPGPQLTLLPAAEHQRLEWRTPPVAPPHDERAHAFRTVDLVRAHADEIDARMTERAISRAKLCAASTWR